MLKEYKMYVKSVRPSDVNKTPGGYKIVEPKDQTDEVWDEFKKVIKKGIFKADMGLKNINHALLSPEERANNNLHNAFMSHVSQYHNKKRYLNDQN